MKIEQLILLKQPDIAEQVRRSSGKLGQEGIDGGPHGREVSGEPVSMQQVLPEFAQSFSIELHQEA